MLRNIVLNDWFTVLFVVCLVILALTKWLFAKRFNDFLSLLANSNYTKIYIKEQKFINLFDGLLFSNLVISMAIFIFLVFKVFYSADIVPGFQLFYKLLLVIGSILIIKVLIDRLIGSLFDIDDLMDAYVFQKITYKNFLGLILLPINILLIFTINPSKTLIYVIICMLFLIIIIGFITSVSSHLKTLKSNLFYFILYLCALEIGPYLILIKVYYGN